jgi:NADPH:quinone reductase-like Zn-dependent oxidoreductase
MASEMLSITTPSYLDPSGYQLSTLPRPIVSEPTEVVIQVYAASINPIDLKLAAGLLKLAVNDECAVFNPVLTQNVNSCGKKVSL